MAKVTSLRPCQSHHSRRSGDDVDDGLPLIGRVDDDQTPMPAYRPQRSTCLLCGKRFESYDPRYNRRCPPCQLRVANGGSFYVSEEYDACF